MKVFADQGSLLGSQHESAELAGKLAAAEQREAAVKLALGNEQHSRQAEAAQAADRDTKAKSAAEELRTQVHTNSSAVRLSYMMSLPVES